jgi:hypothetical protein
MLPGVTSASDLKQRRIRLFIVAVSDDGRLKLIDELVDHELAGRVPHDDESGLARVDPRCEQAEASA